MIVKCSLYRICNLLTHSFAFSRATARNNTSLLQASTPHTHTLAPTCISALLCVHCKLAMNTISHNARTICPLRYKMKMSCYFLVQDSRKYFAISTEENIFRLCSCRILAHCGSEDRDDDRATQIAFLCNHCFISHGVAYFLLLLS